MNFVGYRKLWFAISGLLIALSVFALLFNVLIRGRVMNLGIDFTGGTFLTLRFEKEVSTGLVRDVLKAFDLKKSVIQKTGATDISIRTEFLSTETRTKIIERLSEKLGRTEILEADVVGPVIGREIRLQALFALAVATLGMMIYISFRFEFKYAVVAILALYHDALITTGMVALLWRNVETPFVAAILTIMGYSINDTVVIFDRIRENLNKPGANKIPFAEVVNDSLNQTLARSINTVLTTLIMVLAILLFGGSTLQDFMVVLLIGFVCGAYSSIFVAAPLLVSWQKWQMGKKG